MQNWEQTVLSQYGNSPILLALIEGMNDAIDPRANIDAFFQNVWNIDTAQGYGLDVWGRIVGITRYIQVPSNIDYFGFKTGGSPEHSLPFGSGVFYAGKNSTQTYALSDAAYRSLILFRAMVNIAAVNIPTLNRLINLLLGGITGLYVANGYVLDGYFSNRGGQQAYVVDLGNMQMRYVIGYSLNVYQSAIVNTPGVLPNPSGVKVFIG